MAYVKDIEIKYVQSDIQQLQQTYLLMQKMRQFMVWKGFLP